jgi:hypothetical protein
MPRTGTSRPGPAASLAWPIYMTIGNLDSHTRRQQKRPALILIGFMPIMDGCERLVKAEVYHHILRMIFKRKIISHTFNNLYTESPVDYKDSSGILANITYSHRATAM